MKTGASQNVSGSTVLAQPIFLLNFLKAISSKSFYATHHKICFDRYGHHPAFKIVVSWKLLSFRFRSLSVLVRGPVYALVYSVVMGHSSCCVVCLCGTVLALVYPTVMGLCGTVYALVYPTVMGDSSCCVVSVVPSMR
jgi:hypothetical protein